MAVAFAILDLGALLAAGSVAMLLGAPWLHPEAGAAGRFLGPGVATLLLAFYYSDLYDLRVVRSFAEFANKLLRALLLTIGIFGLAYAVFPAARVPLALVAASVGVGVALVVPARAIAYRVAQARTRRVLILGTGPLARKLADEVTSSPCRGYALAGFIQDLPSEGWPLRYPIVGQIESVEDAIAQLAPDMIVVALTERRGRLPVAALMASWAGGVRVMDGIEFYERLTQKLAIESLNPSRIMFSNVFRKPRHQILVRRLASLLVGLVGLVFSAPLLALTALLIKLDSPGPILFTQERAGRGGRSFRLLKFRTMYHRPDDGQDSVWNRNIESRITGLGRWLRRLRIDELPQFVNLIRGDMDLVGPRPEIASNVKTMTEEIPYYPLRHMVRPGVTGWAQVKYGYSVSREEVAEKTRYDLYYVKHASVGLDLQILADTAKIVLLGRGAR